MRIHRQPTRDEIADARVFQGPHERVEAGELHSLILSDDQDDPITPGSY
jgi:hypothetical protein